MKKCERKAKNKKNIKKKLARILKTSESLASFKRNFSRTKSQFKL